jgi:hypothetical protein
MRGFFVLIVLILAFVLGVLLAPAFVSATGMSDRMDQIRDAMGVCGGSNACMAAEEAAPAAEEAPATEPAAETTPAETAPAEAPPPQ